MSDRNQQDEQATCFACGRGQAGDKHTCQQDECPKAFYCLPESCGDCPDQQDEQATTEGMWFHLQHARWQMNPSSLRDQIDHAIRAKFGQNEVPGVSPMPPRTFAEDERAAMKRCICSSECQADEHNYPPIPDDGYADGLRDGKLMGERAATERMADDWYEMRDVLQSTVDSLESALRRVEFYEVDRPRKPKQHRTVQRARALLARTADAIERGEHE